jgi:hypothetical protein
MTKRGGDLYITSEAFQVFLIQKVMRIPLEGASLFGIRRKDRSARQEIRETWGQSTSK